MKRDYVTVLQLTDLHLFAEAHGLFNEVNTRAGFHAVLNHVQQHYESPDLILMTGDMAHDGEAETYQVIAEALQALSAPVFFVLGNHDNAENAELVYPLAPVQTDKHCVLEHWHIILLDSNHELEPAYYEGAVSEAELARIRALTEQHADKFLLIAMHHNLLAHDDRGIPLQIRNHQQVTAQFEQLANLKAVLSGHVHQEFTIVRNGVCYLSTPSTGYQSKSKSGQITGESAGYRWLKLYDNGVFETDVRRVTTWTS